MMSVKTNANKVWVIYGNILKWRKQMRHSYIAESIMAEYREKQKWKRYYENQRRNKIQEENKKREEAKECIK